MGKKKFVKRRPNQVKYDFDDKDVPDSIDDPNAPSSNKKIMSLDLDMKTDDSSDLEDEQDRKKRSQDILDWGKSKMAYHKFDEDSDEDLEDYGKIEEADLIQKQTVSKHREEDYGDYYTTSFKTSASSQEVTPKVFEQTNSSDFMVQKQLENLTRDQKLEIILRDNPELILLIDSFMSTLEELENKFQPLIKFIILNKIKDTSATRYIKIKFQLLLNYCTNLCFYLYLKSHGHDEIKHHPVLLHLSKLKNLLSKLGVLDDSLELQMEKLLEYVDAFQSEPSDSTQAKSKKDSKPKEQAANEKEKKFFDSSFQDETLEKKLLLFDVDIDEDTVATNMQQSVKTSKSGTDENNAFSIQSSNLRSADQLKTENKLESRIANDEEDYKCLKNNTINSTEPLSHTSHSQFDEKQQVSCNLDSLVDFTSNTKEIPRIGAEFSSEFHEDSLHKDLNQKFTLPNNQVVSGILNKKNNANSKKNSNLHVTFDIDKNVVWEPKDSLLTKRELRILEKVNAEKDFVNMQELPPDGKRKVSKTILENRGLRKHTPKDKKNSRLRRKKQYRKALVKRKSVVPNMRDQSKPYTGEHTGININVVKAIKLS